LLARFAGKSVARAEIRPTVTIVIAAYNEARGIGAKLQNVTSLEYPPDLVDVIVASDASSDATDEIVKLRPFPCAARARGRQTG
jgi:cellulose synthase/poly-beta-1,6-N-acetylglucosamine synthase-like glycosyltransferase